MKLCELFSKMSYLIRNIVHERNYTRSGASARAQVHTYSALASSLAEHHVLHTGRSQGRAYQQLQRAYIKRV